MEWTEASIYTSTEGVELLCGKLLELGINGFAVEDAQDFEAFLEETTPHWDYVDDSLMALKDAETRVIVYLPKNVQGAGGSVFCGAHAESRRCRGSYGPAGDQLRQPFGRRLGKQLETIL